MFRAATRFMSLLCLCCALLHGTAAPAGTDRAFQDLPPVSLHILPDPASPVALGPFTGAVPAPEGRKAQITLNPATKTFTAADGTLLANLSRGLGASPYAQTQAILHKYRVIQALREQAESQPERTLRLSLPDGPSLSFDAPVSHLHILGRQSPFVTVIGLSPKGTVHLIYPKYGPMDQQGQFNDSRRIDPETPLTLPLSALPPFGLEHVIVFETETPAGALRRAAFRYDGQAEIPLFWRDMRFALQNTPHHLALIGFQTTDEN